MNEVERAKASLAKMVPFDEWVRRNNPSADKIALRNRVVAELEAMARGERLTVDFHHDDPDEAP